MEIVISYSILVEPEEEIELINEDPNDNKFLECSIKAKTDYIISGDQYLLWLNRFKGIEIISSKEFPELKKSLISKFLKPLQTQMILLS